MIYFTITVSVVVFLLVVWGVWQDNKIDELEKKIKKVDKMTDINNDLLDGHGRRIEDLQDQLSVLSQTVAENEANNLILDGDVGSLKDKVNANREYLKQHKEVIEAILDEFDKDWEYVEGYQLKDKKD